MASQALANLQATTNRFADLADFSPLAIDGGMGSGTENAVQNVLAFLSLSDEESATDSQRITNSLLAQFNTAFAAGTGQTYIMQNLGTLQQLFDGAASDRHLPPAATVALVKPSADPPGAIPKPDKSAIKATPPPGTSAFALAKFWFRQAPLWQQVGIGVAGGLAVLFGANAWHKKSSTKSAGTAGYRRY